MRSKVRSKGKTKGGGWLGVSIGNVPEETATRFDLVDEGVIVLDVVHASPADKAGLEEHDVIIAIDGVIVEGDVGQAVNLVKSHGPGEEVDVIVLRAGDRMPITVQLGSRAVLRMDEIELTDEGGPLAEVEERIKTRGKILRKGPGDTWVVEDLGDLQKLKDLPKHIEMFMPKSGSRSVRVQVTGDDEDRTMTKTVTRIEDGGTKIMIAGKSGGPIKVTRIDEDGEKSKVEYDDEDELRADDDEAFELWADVGESTIVLDLEGFEIPEIVIPTLDIEIPEIDIPDIDIEIPEFAFEFDSDEWEEATEDWKSHLEESLSEARESYELAMEEFNGAMEQWRESKKLPKDFKLKHWPPMAWPKYRSGKSPQFLHGEFFGKPKHTFEVDTDGTIEVRIRKGDSELVQIYEDEDDLARRSPKLYKKYEKLMGLEKE